MEHLERFSSEKETVTRFLIGLIGSLQRSGLITARMCVTCKFFRQDIHPGEPRRITVVS